jgi:very-short-patch-repair endonuclease
MNETQKFNFLKQEYEKSKKSFKEIAQSVGTYSNKIRRDAIRLKIKIRDKSEAQKNALKSGKVSHPTKGKKRNEQTKQKIGTSVMKSWETLSDEELEKRKQTARNNWEKLSEDQKQNILKQANEAVRQSSKTGSKLEVFLFKLLLENGYKAEFHKEQSILNTKLQIDIFVPKLDVAIEVDGPSHFEPVWGNEALKKNQKYDNKKTGLLIGKGLKVIRVKQTKDFSKSRAGVIGDQLVKILEDIKNNKINSTTINIGDDK